MNKSILSISVFSLLLFTFFISACKKPKRPEDPCKNKVSVIAVNQYEYQWGHFKMRNADKTDIYLYVNNWDQYASQVVPGRRYKIAYKEVDCPECNNKLMLGSNGIREGGCVMFPRKCVEITCFEQIKQTCFESLLYPADFADVYSQAVSSTGITGNSLDVTVGFTGCGQDDALQFSLYTEQLPTVNPGGPSIWSVKAINTFPASACDAYFTKRVCFDLTSIKDACKDMNQSEAIIRLMLDGTTTDFTYKF
jgi:hypothetical protein